MEEGQPGYLHCNVQAMPPAQVTWYRNMQEISEEVSFLLPVWVQVANFMLNIVEPLFIYSSFHRHTIILTCSLIRLILLPTCRY